MPARHRRDAVAPRFPASDAAVAIVVPAPERIVGVAGPRAARCGRRGLRRRRASVEDHVGGPATREHAFQGRGLAPVDAEGVLALDRNDAGGEPAPVPGRQPFARVLATLAAGTAAVNARGGQREVERVGGEVPADGRAGGAEAAIMGLRQGDDVIDVGLPGARERAPGIGAVDPAAKGGGDAC